MWLEFLSGHAQVPHVAIVGVWDPPQLFHTQLYRQLVTHARRLGYRSLAITLDPPPASFAPGESPWSYYSSLDFRQHLQQLSGVTTIATAHLESWEIEV